MDGKTLRSTIPRSAHAAWSAPADRDPVGRLAALFATLLPDLVPLRVARMVRSPFAFYRGSAAIMAADLTTTPTTGTLVQLSGDAHVSNFGGYASPERRLVFDVTDFDESARGPWEWDVKRLAVSLVLAGREGGLRAGACDDVVRLALRSYRDRTAAYAALPPLDVWYASIDVAGAVRSALDARARRVWEEQARAARRSTALALLPTITAVVDGRPRFVDDPPLLEHAADGAAALADAQRIVDAYRQTLRPDARMLLDRYALADVARKVVGVGSVGTWCALLLLTDAHGAPLLLQLKEARASALEPFVAAQAPYGSHGERVVAAQRMMQAASDALLGWAQVGERDLYVRQYRDMKTAPDASKLPADELGDYAAHCAWALARAHARTGEPATVARYIGRGESFVEATAAFARAYADQVAHDHAAFVLAGPALARDAAQA